MNLDKLFKHLQDEHGLNLVWTEKRKIEDCLQASPVPELPIESFDADEWLGDKYGIWSHPLFAHKEVSSLMAEFTNEVISRRLPRWYSVDEVMPGEHEKVLVQFGDQNILVGILDSNQQWTVFWSDGRNISDPDRPICYWMPLPAAYNMEGGED
jgi:hypothetical protein